MHGMLKDWDAGVGIEAGYVYVPPLFMSLETLAEVRKIPKEKYLEGLGLRRMAVPHPLEDPVTMAASAAYRLLSRNDVDRNSIGLMIVGSESGVDESKPIAAFVHRLLGLPSSVRVFDIKHACYSGTAALRMAAEWVASPAARGRKALVISTDVAYYDLHSPGEPTQGAGAIALLVSSRPSLVELHFEHEAVYTQEVNDFWRPSYSLTAFVDGHYSVECYLHGLRSSYRMWRERSGLNLNDFSGFAFHTPFPKMASKAFKALWRLEHGKETDCQDEYVWKVAPSIRLAQELGNVYSSSLMGALFSLLISGTVNEGDRVAMFSYGSGSTSEFFSVVVRSIPEPESLGLDRLDMRREIYYEDYLLYRSDYERKWREGSYDDRSLRHELEWFDFLYLGINKEHLRIYERARSTAEYSLQSHSVGHGPLRKQ